MVGLRCPWASFVVGERPRSLHGIQQSFQETNRETPNNAKPQAVTTSDNRLTDISEKVRQESITDNELSLLSALLQSHHHR